MRECADTVCAGAQRPQSLKMHRKLTARMANFPAELRAFIGAIPLTFGAGELRRSRAIQVRLSGPPGASDAARRDHQRTLTQQEIKDREIVYREIEMTPESRRKSPRSTRMEA